MCVSEGERHGGTATVANEDEPWDIESVGNRSYVLGSPGV
jgi:hypothetical protein